jgi:hypothetical protein
MICYEDYTTTLLKERSSEIFVEQHQTTNIRGVALTSKMERRLFLYIINFEIPTFRIHKILRLQVPFRGFRGGYIGILPPQVRQLAEMLDYHHQS